MITQVRLRETTIEMSLVFLVCVSYGSVNILDQNQLHFGINCCWRREFNVPAAVTCYGWLSWSVISGKKRELLEITINKGNEEVDT